MGKVIILETTTTLDIPVSRVLDGARGAEIVLVLSYDDQCEMKVASSTGDCSELNWMLDKAKEVILKSSP